MGCYICGRQSCAPSFHSLEEQRYFERAEDAYDRYLEILEECRDEYRNRELGEDSSDD